MPRRPQVTRKILFYRLRKVTPAGSSQADTSELFQHLLDRAGAERVVVQSWGEGTCLAAWLDREAPPHALRLGLIRQSGLPPKANTSGTLSDLGLNSDEGLAEISHIMLFSGGIVGAEFNFYGPRAYSLTAVVTPDDASISYELEPILRSNVQAQLDRLTDIRLFQLRTHASYATTLARASPDLQAAVEAMSRAGNAELVEVVARSGKFSRASIGQRFLRIARRIVRLPDFQENIEKFEIRGFDPATERVEKIDALHDKLVVERTVVLQDGRSGLVVSDSAYSAVQNAHQLLRDQLRERPRD